MKKIQCVCVCVCSLCMLKASRAADFENRLSTWNNTIQLNTCGCISTGKCLTEQKQAHTAIMFDLPPAAETHTAVTMSSQQAPTQKHLYNTPQTHCVWNKKKPLMHIHPHYGESIIYYLQNIEELVSMTATIWSTEDSQSCFTPL